MGKETIYLGENQIHSAKAKVSGHFVELYDEKYYQILNYHEMPDFFISIVSDTDLWMFLSSNGSLSAGRKNRENALFPYYTDDKIHDYHGITGSKTVLLVKRDSKTFLWEPFKNDSQHIYHINRNLYKSIYGNKIIFEEVNDDLGVSFRYGWQSSEKFGFVKKSCILNLTDDTTEIKVLDGIKNILPYGVDYAFQNEFSNLLDAYKKNELIEGSTLGLFMLSSIPVDRAEPSEALKVTTVWSTGFADNCKILLSDKQVSQFTLGLAVDTETDIRASRGAYYINSEMVLGEKAEKHWYTIADINQDSTDVANLNSLIRKTENIEDLIRDDIQYGTLNLKKMVSFADGFQMTNSDISCVRHYTNTLYNIMRGGVFINNYIVDTNDFKYYLEQINKSVSKEKQELLDKFPDQISYLDLISRAEEDGNPDLLRITYEYLPLTFSRRHGDPSRPWNLFSIETRNDDGSVKYNYQGNWRDIFQNWEALCYSFPEFIEGIISKFVNASTIDGYNPYRIMREGIDWECPDPNDHWSYIGYWGDHQIIYLQKLLEISADFHPGQLDTLLTQEIFTYANVPYQIKSTKELLENPKDTVTFNEDLNILINSNIEHLGADAKLLRIRGGDHIYKVNLTEKILVTLLSKLCNFIPEAGIWMNTQRPEWNDANNALVGNGTSMVTLYYLRRFLKFWDDTFKRVPFDKISISNEVGKLFEEVSGFLISNQSCIERGFSDKDRKNFVENLGGAHEKYREEIYHSSFSGARIQMNVKDLSEFTGLCLKFIDQSINTNKRTDDLYHSYNLISINTNSISVRNLYEMLEGQVAVLSSGYLSTEESLRVLNTLKKSKIFRKDQQSYMLYPNRQLPRFTEKNNIPDNLINESDLFKQMLEDKENSIINRDKEGRYHFNGIIRNVFGLKDSLNKLRDGKYRQLIENEQEKILNIYESIFDHQSFTGRSGTFYGYEGLGSIYWHMVSKLLIATQECYFKAVEEGEDQHILGQLQDHYYEIKVGIGSLKSPDQYGAFPMDAYSHTPAGAGVKQPGLTGQVKEDVISRIKELGILIEDGKIRFDTSLLHSEEILAAKTDFEYYSVDKELCKISLDKNQFALTFCQVPVVLSRSNEEQIKITYRDQDAITFGGLTINPELSALIFKRSGKIEKIEVFTPHI